MTQEFDFSTFLEGIKRKADLTSWLAGNPPYSETEDKIRAEFLGPDADLYSRMKISLIRKGSVHSYLAGDGVLSEDEQKVTDSMIGPAKDLYSTMAVSEMRKGKIIRFLSGEPIEELLKDNV
jgi:hypothetical protein